MARICVANRITEHGFGEYRRNCEPLQKLAAAIANDDAIGLEIRRDILALGCFDLLIIIEMRKQQSIDVAKQPRAATPLVEQGLNVHSPAPHRVNAYRAVEIDHQVPIRLIGPDGRQHRQLSRALSLIHADLSHNPQFARRTVAIFLAFLNILDRTYPDPADAIVEGVVQCRLAVDRYLKLMRVQTVDVGGGCMFVTPRKRDHRAVANTLVAVGRVTRALTDDVYGGQDPSKVDHAFRRVGGEWSTSVGRNGLIRRDSNRRLRIGGDPTLMPRLEDPRVYERWQEGLELIGAPEALSRVMATLRFAGMRTFQALGLTLHDVFCVGRRRTLPVPNKGDRTRSRTLHKTLPPEEWDRLMAYVDAERAAVTGMSLRDIRLIAIDHRRWQELEALPLFTENGKDHIEYARLYRVTRAAAEAMGLVFDDEDFRAGGTKRYANLHLLRHERVYERLGEIEQIHENRQAEARRSLIHYMGWSGEAMLRWYSAHYRIGEIGRAAAEHNLRIGGMLEGLVDHVERQAFDEGLERMQLAVAEL